MNIEDNFGVSKGAHERISTSAHQRYGDMLHLKSTLSSLNSSISANDDDSAKRIELKSNSNNKKRMKYIMSQQSRSHDS